MRSGDTPADRFRRALAKAEDAVTELEDVMQSLGRVAGEDNVPLVDTRGFDPDPVIGEAWRAKLSDVDDNLGFWVKTARKKAGSAATAMYDYGAPLPDVPAEDSIGEDNWDEPNAVAAE